MAASRSSGQRSIPQMPHTIAFYAIHNPKIFSATLAANSLSLKSSAPHVFVIPCESRHSRIKSAHLASTNIQLGTNLLQRMTWRAVAAGRICSLSKYIVYLCRLVGSRCFRKVVVGWRERNRGARFTASGIVRGLVPAWGMETVKTVLWMHYPCAVRRLPLACDIERSLPDIWWQRLDQCRKWDFILDVRGFRSGHRLLQHIFGSRPE